MCVCLLLLHYSAEPYIGIKPGMCVRLCMHASCVCVRVHAGEHAHGNVLEIRRFSQVLFVYLASVAVLGEAIMGETSCLKLICKAVLHTLLSWIFFFIYIVQ